MDYKYKCNNKDCGHKFTADEPCDSCPECGGENISISSGMPKKVKYGIIGGAVFLILMIFFFRDCSDEKTIVNVNFDKSNNKLTVELLGDKVKSGNNFNYKIFIKMNGQDFGKTINNSKLEKIFDMPGTYDIEVKWVNNSEPAPQISWNGLKTFTITEKPNENQPRILNIKLGATDVKKQLYLSVIVETDTTVLSKSQTEFSQDGSIYQSSNTFSNLSPGKYTFYVRNSSYPNKFDKYEKELMKIQKESPSDAYLNDLLKKIAKRDDIAYDNWIDNVECGIKIPVTGINNIKNSTELIDKIYNDRKSVTVNTKRDANNKIIRIIVK